MEQVNDGEQEDPDQVDEVPVQREVFNYVVVLLVMIIIGSNLADTGLNGKNRGGDLLSEPLPVIPHAGQASPAAAPAHH